MHLDDGRDLPAGLLVGADGLHSPVRTLIDPQARPPRPVGQRIYYGFSPRPLSARTGDFHLVPSGTPAFGAVPTAGGWTWWFARVHTPVPVPPPDADPGAVLRGVLDGGIAADVIGAAERVFVTDAHDLPHVGRWYARRMLLVGDAAHAASPATGQGASMALEDAVVLAKALRDSAGGEGPDPAVAASRYERARRGRTQANVVASAALSGHRVPDAEPGEVLPDPVLHAHLDWALRLP